MAIPGLPHSEMAWSHNIHIAQNILSTAYQLALQVLRSEDGDSLRLRHHSTRIVNSLVPILEALEREGLPEEWSRSCARAFGGLMLELETAAIRADQE